MIAALVQVAILTFAMFAATVDGGHYVRAQLLASVDLVAGDIDRSIGGDQLTYGGASVSGLDLQGSSLVPSLPEYRPCRPAAPSSHGLYAATTVLLAGEGPLHFVAWLGDDLGLVFADGSGLSIVDLRGLHVREIVDGNLGFVGNPRAGRGYGMYASYSPSAGRLVYTSCEDGVGRPEIARVALDGTDRRRITSNGRQDRFPVWSPDGSKIAFMSGDGYWDRLARIEIVDGGDWIPGDAAEVEASINVYEVLRRNLAGYPPVWSPDGEHIAFLVDDQSFAGDAPWDLYTVKVDGSEFRRIADVAGAASWSPDGRRLAFATRDGSDAVVVVSDSDGSNAVVLAKIVDWASFHDYSDTFDYWSYPHPVSWSPDGAHLLHICESGICVIDTTGRRIGTSPVELVAERSRPVAAWSPDGSRIAVRTSENDPAHGSALLLTMAPDGSSVEVLVRAGVGLTAANSGYNDVAQGVASCSEGFVVPSPAENPGLVGDCETLIGLRETLFGECLYARNRTTCGSVVSNWGPGTPIDQWAGVTVSESPPRVTALRLDWFGFSGTVPAALGELTELRSLDLVGNRLRGAVPAELANLTNLQSLDLSFNEVSGRLPPELGRLVQLRQLDIGANDLTGEIPEEYERLRSLQYLRLGGNQLSGVIPAWLGSLTELQRLGLSGNQLGGEIPGEIGQLPRLTQLGLGWNNFEGRIPTQLGNLSNLTGLNLSSNQLTGEIPAGLGRLTQLRTLSLAENELEGAIPAEFAQLTELDTLYLEGNRLTGCLPPTLRDVRYNDLLQLRLPDCGIST